MQLYEAGKARRRRPRGEIPAGFAANDKEKVTIRELLTHYSGLPPDVNLKDAWGLAAPDKAEGIRRAMESPLTTTPGTHFEYSDINYIVLGALVEKLSGETLDVYAQNTSLRRSGCAYAVLSLSQAMRYPRIRSHGSRQWRLTAGEDARSPDCNDTLGTYAADLQRSRPPPMTTRAPPKPIPTSTTSSAARSTIPPPGAWAA